MNRGSWIVNEERERKGAADRGWCPVAGSGRSLLAGLLHDHRLLDHHGTIVRQVGLFIGKWKVRRIMGLETLWLDEKSQVSGIGKAGTIRLRSEHAAGTRERETDAGARVWVGGSFLTTWAFIRTDRCGSATKGALGC